MHLTHSYSSIKLFENCPLRYYRQRIKKDVVDEGSEESKYGDRVHKSLENRLKGDKLDVETKQYEPLCQAVEALAERGKLFIEHPLALTDELVPTDWQSPNAWLRSILDVLVVADDEAVVMDWKTGKRRFDKLQMQLFAAQVFKHFPEVEKVKTSLVWLASSEIDTELYLRKDINVVWSDILNRIRRIYDAYENNYWVARPSKLCHWCPCRHDCDFAAV